jgi:uncharacterized protein YpmB
MIFALIIVAVVCITSLGFQQRSVIQTNAQHAAQLAEKDHVILGLITQVQANSQNQPYYPTLGPAPAAEPEIKYLSSPDGLIVFPDYDVDSALDEVAR